MTLLQTIAHELQRMTRSVDGPSKPAQLDALTAAFFGYPSWEALALNQARLESGLPKASALWVRPSLIEAAIPPAWSNVVFCADVITECSDALRTGLPADTLLLVADDLGEYGPELIETKLIPDVVDMLDGALKEARLAWSEIRFQPGSVRDDGAMVVVTVTGAVVEHRGPGAAGAGVIFDVVIWFTRVAGEIGLTGPDVQVTNIDVVSDARARSRCKRASDAGHLPEYSQLH